MTGLTRWQKGWKSLLATVLLSLLVVQPAVFSGGAARAAVDTSLEEARMLELVNQARNGAGLPSLTVDPRLTDLARRYSREMVDYGFFGHESPVSGGLQQRISASGITGWSLAGENLAKAPSTETAFQALMNSPSHRQNILRPEFNCIGIGVVEGRDGLYITQEFMRFDSMGAGAGVAAPAVSGSAPQKVPAASVNTFDTYLLIMNPNPVSARVEVVFQSEDGTSKTLTCEVGASSRFTVPVREAVGTGSFSATVSSDLPVLAERAMYFEYQGKAGGSDSIGTPRPSNTWFFAEGYTGESFDTWVLLQNPNDAPATVTLSFMRSDGAVITRQVSVPGRRRHSVHLDEIPGLESAEVSTQVSSDLPVVAERAMYFDYHGRRGGHASVGATSAREKWYLPEGYTGGKFDEYVLLLNPNVFPVSTKVTFMRPDGQRVERLVTLAPNSRHTIHVDEVEGLQDSEVSTAVEATLPVVAELAQYFDFRGRSDGNNSIGATEPSTTWYFAEGCVL